jgi:selenocysteine lyase/cysteine desulfurase
VAFAENDIRKFEHIGTHPVATHLSILDAIDFHEAIGGKRKEARLRYLKDYWVDRVADISGVTINTPRSAEQSCAIANVMVDGTTPDELVDILLDRYGIFTVAVDSGARIAPNLWTTTRHLDTLVKAITEISRSG